MSRMQKTPLLALVAILALIGLCLVGVAEEGNALNLPNALPDGSTLVSVKDVFTEVADEATAQQLRAHMPHVLGGTEYRYVLEKDGQVESEWGIVVFEFENEQVALGDFQHLADNVAFVNKNPRFVRIEGAEDVPEIQQFLESDLEYACLMNEIVIFPLGHYLVWVDDYQLHSSAESNAFLKEEASSILRATSVAEEIFALSTPAIDAGPGDVSEAADFTLCHPDLRISCELESTGYAEGVELGILCEKLHPSVDEELTYHFFISQCWELNRDTFEDGAIAVVIPESVKVNYDRVGVLTAAGWPTGPRHWYEYKLPSDGCLEAALWGLLGQLPLPRIAGNILGFIDTVEEVIEKCGSEYDWLAEQIEKVNENEYDVLFFPWRAKDSHGVPRRGAMDVQISMAFKTSSLISYYAQFKRNGRMATWSDSVLIEPAQEPGPATPVEELRQLEHKKQYHSTSHIPAIDAGPGDVSEAADFTLCHPDLRISCELESTGYAEGVELGILCEKLHPSVDEELTYHFFISQCWELNRDTFEDGAIAVVIPESVKVNYDRVGVLTAAGWPTGPRHWYEYKLPSDGCLEAALWGLLGQLPLPRIAGNILGFIDTVEEVIEKCGSEYDWLAEQIEKVNENEYDVLFFPWRAKDSHGVPRRGAMDVQISMAFKTSSLISYYAQFKRNGRMATWSDSVLIEPAQEPGPATPVEKALEWLRTKQNPETGSWDYYGFESVGITALATLAFLNAGYEASDQTVKAGLDYIVSQYNDEGWISAGGVKRGSEEVILYDTSMAVLPLTFAIHANYNPPSGFPSLHTILYGAAHYLGNKQCMDPSDVDSYGGWGYPREGWADLSNTQWVLLALEAIRREESISAPMPDWNAAATFVARCWNDPRNPYTTRDDGGFIYRPKDTAHFAGGNSYGSMTGAGVWSLLICGWNGVSTIQLSPGNSVSLAEVLQKGLDWLAAKGEVQSNTNAGDQWYYYYLVTVAKAYLFAGENVGIDWYNRMAFYITQELQQSDGHFPSVYGEEPDVMATAEAVLALLTRAEPSEMLQDTELWIILASHADLHVYDSKGRHVGRDYETGLIDIEIPGASYRADGTQAIGISRPSAGKYRIELVGTSYGEYSLTVESRRAGKKISSENFSGIIEEGEKHSTTATLTSIVGPLTVFVGKPRPLPEGLYAIPGDGQIELHWRSYTDPGFQLAGYNVYRSTRSGGGYTRVNASLTAGTEYTDKRTKSWKTYYYVITAVDRSGNETGYSPEAEGIAFPQGLLESIVRLILGILQAILSLFGL